MTTTRIYTCQRDEDKLSLLATIILSDRENISAYDAVEMAENIVKAVAERKQEETEEFNQEPFWVEDKEKP